MQTLRTLTVVFVLCALALPVLASGGSKIEETETEAPASPEQQANEAYNAGLQHRDDAWRLAKKLRKPDVPEAKQEKMRNNIRRAYESAAKEFGAAVSHKPDHYQALTGLGYAYRQLGDYANAMQAYDAALAINPEYGEAIEYRAEAYLGLNRINDAQNAYRILLEQNEKLAAELLGSMQGWIEARRKDLAGLEQGQLDGFATWVADREQQAGGSSLHKGGW
jgi:tetratricopeptide (TPR) repeat protein